MNQNYGPLVQAANELNQYSGYLDTEGQKALGAAKGQYRGLLSRTSYELIGDHGSAAAASQQAARDLQSWASSEPEWADTILQVMEDLLAQIDADSRKSGLRRWVRYYALPIGVALAVTAYLGTWWYNHLTIDRPLESREGLIQRAEAYDKTRQYDDLMGGRGGLIKRAILSAVEPDEDELRATQEFFDVVLQGHAMLEQQGKVCGLPIIEGSGDTAEQRLALVDLVSAQLQDPKTRWETPPVMTVLPIIAQTRPCPDPGKIRQAVEGSIAQ